MERKINIVDKIKEELLTCPICSDLYQDPRLLPCQHVICWDCLHAYVLQYGGDSNSFPCPFCKVETHIPKKGLQSMKKCLAIGHIKDVLPSEDISCTTCGSKEDIDVYLCMDCSKYTCSKCIVIHSERAHKRDLKMSYIEGRLAENERLLNETSQKLISLIENLQTQFNSYVTYQDSVNKKFELCHNREERILNENIQKSSETTGHLKTLMSKHDSCYKKLDSAHNALDSKITLACNKLSDIESNQSIKQEQMKKKFEIAHDKMENTLSSVINVLSNIQKIQQETKSQMKSLMSKQDSSYNKFETAHNRLDAKVTLANNKLSDIESNQNIQCDKLTDQISGCEEELTESIDNSQTIVLSTCGQIKRTQDYEMAFLKREIDALQLNQFTLQDKIEKATRSNRAYIYDVMNNLPERCREEFFRYVVEKYWLVFVALFLYYLLASFFAVTNSIKPLQNVNK